MKTIVISDLHLGLDDRISEDVRNRPKLADFIDKIRVERMADELVIAGDFLDQWFYPGSAELPRDSREFYLACAKNNQVVVDALVRLIESGIPVVYVPGNHDMTMTYEVLAEIVPGIRQARDVPGLGRYRTGVRGEVVIEHSHRYEIMCAPDTVTNADLVEYGFPMLPPGYFFARVGVQSVAEGVYLDKDRRAACRKDLPELPKPNPSDELACAAYAYWKVWADIINDWYPVEEGMDDAFVKVAVDGLAGEFSLNDLLPSMQPDGSLSAPLYRDLVNNWDEVQRRNLVPAPVSAAHSLKHAADNEERIEELPARVYFDVDPTVDVVVFGHTHVPGYKDFTGYDRPKVFANSGTWVDDNMDDPANTATFVLVESTAKGDVVQTLKCIGDGKVDSIVPVENDHIRRAD